jgi:hypothetical protein
VSLETTSQALKTTQTKINGTKIKKTKPFKKTKMKEGRRTVHPNKERW